MLGSSKSTFAPQVFGACLALYLLTSSFTHPALLINYNNYLPEARRAASILILREVSFVIITLICLFTTLAKKEQENTVKTGVILVLSYGLILAIRTIILGDGWLLLAGLRVLSTILGVAIIPVVVARDPSLINLVIKTMKFVITIQLLFCLFQLATLQPYFGGTFLGARTFGTLGQPIHLAIFSGSIVVLFATRCVSLPWIIIGLFVTLTTGGRAGLMIAIVGIAFIGLRKFSFPGYSRYLAYGFVPFLLFISQYIVSHPALSGRSGTVGGALSDARWTTWANALTDYLQADLATVLLGQGLGMGSNSVALQISLHTDSTPVFLMLSFGIFGLLLIICAFSLIWYKSVSIPGLIAWILVGLTQLVFELHPISIILLSAIPLKSTDRIMPKITFKW